MSLILEALRRSEAERRRAAPPSLLGDTAPPPKSASSPWPIALGGLGAGLLLATVAWWWGSTRNARTAEPALVQAPAERPAEARVEPVPAAAYAPPSVPSAPAAPAPRAAALPASAPAAMASEHSPAPPPAATPAPTEGSTGPRDGDLRWSEVAAGGLPALRVSMHVYADDPTRRFAIIDGQRRREGDTLQPGLVLLEIRRDGLRIRWQERVLWVPR